MLEVKPIQEKAAQENLCELCGITYRENNFAYGAEVDGSPVGICQFYIRGEYGHISELASVKGKNDGEAMFILGRAALNFIDLAGAHEAYFDGADAPLVRAIGFSEKDGRLYMDLSAFFDNPCKNKK